MAQSNETDLSALLQQLLLQQAQHSQGAPSVSTVSLKLPEFWMKSPEVWFARVESQFNTRGISQDQTKYDYVVGTLDINTAEEMQAVLTNPPETEKYETLKRALIKTFGKSQVQKDFELLNLNGMGDKRPTALLRKINALNDDPQTLKRALFLANLPNDMKCILASQNISNIEHLAEAADRIWETKSTAMVSSVAPPDTISGVPTQFYSGGVSNSHVDALRFRNNRQQTNSTANRPERFVCFFHTKFGPKARRCQPGCSFSTAAGNDKASS